MRICYVVSTFPRFENDPEVPWLVETVRRLSDKGIEVEIFAPSYQGIRSHQIFGIPVHRFRYFFKRWEVLTHNEGATNKIRRSPVLNLLGFFYIFFGSLAILRLCASRRYDLFQAHWPFPHALFAWIGARLQKASFSLRFYGAELMLADRFFFIRPFLRFFMKRANTIDAITNFPASKARAIFDCDIRIIPFGSPIPMQAIDDRPKPISNQKQILFVARLIERKGAKYLIEALPLVRSQGIDAKLTLVYSSGDQEAQVKEAIQQAGVQCFVTLAGKVPADELVKLYKNCDLFVLPAIVDSQGDTEMLGVVFLEAMTYKKPIIGSNVGGIPDVIKDGKSGLLVPPNSPNLLANAIVRVLSDTGLADQLGEGGYRFSQDYFNWDRITDSLIEEYKAGIGSIPLRT